MRSARLLPLVLPFLLLPACGGDDEIAPAKVQITQGQETDVWSKAPRVTTIEITEKDKDGARDEILTLEPPDDLETPLTFEARGSKTVQYEIRGLDAAGETQVLGLTPWMVPDTLKTATLLTFVGRVGQFGRAPYTFANPQGERTAASMVTRYLMVMGAELSTQIPVDAYDFGLWGTTSFGAMMCPKSPCKVETFAVSADGVALAIGADWALEVNLSQGYPENATEISLPSALESWGDLAGGAVFQDLEARETYIVGATRAEIATPFVLRMSAEGTLSILELAVARMGAAAAWVEGKGLLVAGGAETAPGAELLPSGADAFSPVALPADAVTGASIGVVDDQVLRLGGRLLDVPAETVVLDLSCDAECAPVAYGSGPLGLNRVTTLPLKGEPLLAFGDDEDGYSLMKRVAPDGFTEIALRESRRGATAVPSAWGQVLVVGGSGSNGVGSDELEVYTPACLGTCEEDE